MSFYVVGNSGTSTNICQLTKVDFTGPNGTPTSTNLLNINVSMPVLAYGNGYIFYLVSTSADVGNIVGRINVSSGNTTNLVHEDFLNPDISRVNDIFVYGDYVYVAVFTGGIYRFLCNATAPVSLGSPFLSLNNIHSFTITNDKLYVTLDTATTSGSIYDINNISASPASFTFSTSNVKCNSITSDGVYLYMSTFSSNDVTTSTLTKLKISNLTYQTSSVIPFNSSAVVAYTNSDGSNINNIYFTRVGDYNKIYSSPNSIPLNYSDYASVNLSNLNRNYYQSSVLFSTWANPFFSNNLAASTNFVSGTPITLSVTATTVTASVQYQWSKNGSIIGSYSATNTLTIQSPVSGDKYICTAKDANANTTQSFETTLQAGLVVTTAPITITLINGVAASENPFQPFVVTGASSPVEISISSTPANAPVVIPVASGVNNGVFKVTGTPTTNGTFTYLCIATSTGAVSANCSFVIQVVSQATYNAYTKGSFRFTNAYPTDPVKQAGLWNATVTALSAKNTSATIYDLVQSSGSTDNNTSSNTTLDNDVTFTYDGDTYSTQGDVPCLLGFSEILMADGTRKAIRDIQAGEEVISALTHKPMKVKAIRRRVVDYRALNQENYIRVIPKGFFGENSPSRDLYISGLHCVMLKVADTTGLPRNRLSFQSRRLSNNLKVLTQDEILKATEEDEVFYYHIDLDGLDAVYAEDVPVESYYYEN
jgi:hypothetical protein